MKEKKEGKRRRRRRRRRKRTELINMKCEFIIIEYSRSIILII